MLRPYTPGDILYPGYRGEIETIEVEPLRPFDKTCEVLFHLHNHDRRPDGSIAPSMSVGDVIVFGAAAALSVASVGFVDVDVDRADISPMSWLESLPSRVDQ
jgi:hypothetical protein